MKKYLKSTRNIIIKNEYLPYLIYFFVMLVIYSRCMLRPNTDDYSYREALNNLSIMEWVYQRAITWQPRIASDFSLAIINFNMPIWSLLNAIVSTIALFTIGKIATIKQNNKVYRKYIYIIICCSYFTIYPYVLNSATFWYTGSFHYLWPFTAMIVALASFCYALSEESIVYKNLKVIFVLASIYACYTEQTIAVLVCFGGASLLFMSITKKKIPKYLFIQYITILVNSVFFLYVNTIGNRSEQELHWYPDYPMLSIVDKVFQGVNWTNFHYINSSNLLFLILTILLSITIWKKYNGLVRYLGLIPLLFILAKIIPFGLLLKNINNNNSIALDYLKVENPYAFEEVMERMFYNTTYANPSNLNISWSDLLPAFCGIFIMLFTAILIYLAFDKTYEIFIGVLLYLAALALGYIMSFSPTIFASGVRVFFIGNMMIILLIGMLISNFSKIEEVQSAKLFKGLFIILILISTLMMIQFVAYFTTFQGIL